MNTIDIFPWDAHFDTGLDEVDAQHRRLVALLNQLAGEVAYGSEPAGLDDIFEALTDYTVYHFETEEAIWRAYLPGEPDEAGHREAHARFVETLRELRAGQAGGRPAPEVAEAMLAFLARWLASHILESDRHMAYRVQALREGLTPAAARERADARMSGASRALIDLVLSIYGTLTANTLKLMREIGERQHAESELRVSEERLRLALAAADQAWFEVELASGRVIVSPEYPRMIGFDPATFDTDVDNWIANVHPDERASVMAAFDLCVRDGGPCKADYRRRAGGGGWKWIRSIGKIAQWDAQGQATRMVGIHTDITQLKEHESQLEHIAHYDVLTGLPNRALLADRLRQAMAHAQRRGERLAVVYIDLDEFKAVNDAHGHDIGDQLLIQLAERMTHALRDGDTIARLGGDEFVALLPDLAGSGAGLAVIGRLLAAAADPVSIDGRELRISASLGVTHYPQIEDVDADHLLNQADQAMYQAKLAGRNRYHLFDAERDRDARAEHENLERLRQALTGEEFELHYQPKVNLRTGAVVGFEALIRWRHPRRGLLEPALFLPLIANHPLSIELGDWVLESALARIEAWKAGGMARPLSINVDAMQIHRPDFVDRLRAALARHPAVGPGDLELEILETSALRDFAHVTRVMRDCRELGVDFALDDFGTGYSSLTYLRRLPAGQLKIDQSFVRGMLDDPDDLAILEGVLGLAGAFRRRVIAEGVETLAHGEMLLRLGCELGQGYAIAPPMPADALPGWLATWRLPHAWLDLPRYNRDDLPVLFAAVEHRAWIATIDAHLRGERENPPPLDPRQCRFGAWLDDEGRMRHGGSAVFDAVERLHLEIHERVDQLLDLKRHGQAERAIARIGEVHALRDVLLAELLALLG